MGLQIGAGVGERLFTVFATIADRRFERFLEYFAFG
jgi:hypothetical protein